jgi:hypothetical protein
VTCDVAAQQALPENFPAELQPTVPEGFAVSDTEVAPFLRVTGRIPPRPEFDPAPHGTAVVAVINVLRTGGWQFNLHSDTEAAEYDFVTPDGRTGLLSGLPVVGCPGYVDLTFEAHWVTP